MIGVRKPPLASQRKEMEKQHQQQMYGYPTCIIGGFVAIGLKKQRRITQAFILAIILSIVFYFIIFISFSLQLFMKAYKIY